MEITAGIGFAAFLGGLLGLFVAYRLYSRRISIEVEDVLRCRPSF